MRALGFFFWGGGWCACVRVSFERDQCLSGGAEQGCDRPLSAEKGSTDLVIYLRGKKKKAGPRFCNPPRKPKRNRRNSFIFFPKFKEQTKTKQNQEPRKPLARTQLGPDSKECVLVCMLGKWGAQALASPSGLQIGWKTLCVNISDLCRKALHPFLSFFILGKGLGGGLGGSETAALSFQLMSMNTNTMIFMILGASIVMVRKPLILPYAWSNLCAFPPFAFSPCKFLWLQFRPGLVAVCTPDVPLCPGSLSLSPYTWCTCVSIYVCVYLCTYNVCVSCLHILYIYISIYL